MSMFPENKTKTLRPDQAATIEWIREALLDGHRRVMVAAPTGAGKTVIAAKIIEMARAKNKRVAFVVPAIDLIDQTVERLREDGIEEVGVEQATHERSNWDEPIQVCSVQTLLARGLERLKGKFDLVIIDEAHTWFKFYGDWMFDQDWLKIPFIGLSATPWTKGLGAFYTKLVIAGTTQSLIDRGVLCNFKVYGPTSPDLSEVRISHGEYHEGDLSKVMNTTKLVADVVETYQTLGEGRPALCYGVDRAHAKAMQLKFQQAGIAAGYQDMHTKPMQRRRIAREFHEGSLQVVCNVGTLTKGIDWDVRCIIMARPTRSEMLFVQIVGRGLRTAKGKDYCLILDHSDNHQRLGFVTDIIHTELDDGSKKPKNTEAPTMPLPKPCPQCKFLKPPRTAKCPACGFVAEIASEIQHAEGELVEITRKAVAKRFGTTMDDKRRTFGMLLAIAARRGRQRGWASWKYREIYDVWPNSLSDAEHVPPTVEMLDWVKSKDIAYAKGKAKHQEANP